MTHNFTPLIKRLQNNAIGGKCEAMETPKQRSEKLNFTMFSRSHGNSLSGEITRRIALRGDSRRAEHRPIANPEGCSSSPKAAVGGGDCREIESRRGATFGELNYKCPGARLINLTSGQNLEAKKVSDWNAKMAKIEEASRKKDELNVEFMAQTKEALINKMEHSEEKREAIISDLKEKLKVILQT